MSGGRLQHEGKMDVSYGSLRGDGADGGRTGGLTAFSNERKEENETRCISQLPAWVLALAR